jgi:hypothetical protein
MALQVENATIFAYTIHSICKYASGLFKEKQQFSYFQDSLVYNLNSNQ